MHTTHKGGPDSQAAIDAERLVSRSFPDRRTAERRDPTTEWLIEVDRRQSQRRFSDDSAEFPFWTLLS